jgi:CRP-like cAMP-binding protein
MPKRKPPSRTAPSTGSRLLGNPTKNHLLAALSSSDYARVSSRLETVPLKLRQLVHRSGERLKHVHFPTEGFFSELAVLATGDMVEVTTIGREGMTGWSAGLGAIPVTSTTMVQGEMEMCHRMTVGDFIREMERRGDFYTLINRYRQALMGVIMQSTACNAVHSLEQRLARWLLMAQDRMAQDQFVLTQEFVAMMLGAARPTVSVVAATLQKSGLITYHRGRVRILDRTRLEAAACECYAASTNLLRGVVAAEQ